MKKKLPFDRAVPPTSERFHLAMEYALEHLEEGESKKTTTKTRLGLALALVLALALMATAFALTNGFGILEYFSGREEAGVEPLEGAQALVQTDLGSAEKLGCRVSLSEAVYTGPNVLLMVDVTDGRGAMSGFSIGLERPDAQPHLQYDTVHMDRIDDDLPEGVSYRQYYEFLITDTPPEDILVRIDAEVLIPQDTRSEPREATGEAYGGDLSLYTTVRQTRGARSAAFIADETAAAQAGLEIRAVRAQYTDLEAVVTIEYVLGGERVEQTLYGTPNGKFFHTDPTCSGMKDARPLDDLEGKRACPVCVAHDAPRPAPAEYIAEGSPYVHTDPGCALLDGLESERVPDELSPSLEPHCPVCGGLERRVVFHPLDERGGEIATDPIAWREIDAYVTLDEERTLLRRQILRMQTSEEIPAALLLNVEETTNDAYTNFLAGSGEVLCPPIRCERSE